MSGKDTVDEVEEKQQVKTDEEPKDVLKLFGVRINVENTRPTKVLVRLNQVKSGGPPVYFVHSIEGDSSTLETLGKCLQVPAYCFQCVENAPQETIETLAGFYVKVKILQYSNRANAIG